MNWREQAACLQHDPRLWFPNKPGVCREALDALQICRGCPVSTQCLQYALSNGENHGIWGGMTADERARMRRRQAASR